MVKKMNSKWILFLMILGVAFMSTIFFRNATATVVGDSESIYKVFNSDDELTLTITMKKGDITIEGRSSAASSSIRWRTKGLTITRNRINTSATAKGYPGFGPVSDAYGKGKAVLMFDNAVEKSDVKKGGIVITTIKFSAAQVEAALKDNFDDITKDTIIYLHGIFETYDYNAATDTSTVRPGKSYIDDWKDIMNAELWPESTLQDFSKYFNMEIEFKPAPQPNTLYYCVENGNNHREILGEKELLPALPDNPNTPVSWSNEPTVKNIGTKKYSLVKYYVTGKSNTLKRLVEHSVDDGYALSKISSGSYSPVKIGGMNVFLIYREAPTISITPTPTPKVSTTPTPSPVPSAKPSPTPVIVPVAEVISEPMAKAEGFGTLRADKREGERFTVNQGIATTESLFANVVADKYLMGYELTKKVGIETYSVKVKKDYILKWQGKDAKGKKQMTETVTIPYFVTIKRAYGYWEITNFDYYKIAKAEIDNYALPGGKVVMTPDRSAGYKIPDISISHSASKESHIIIPDQIKDGVVLPAETITGGTSKPRINSDNFEDFTDAADKMIPELTVKNDSLVIDGTTIMNADPSSKEGSDVYRDFLTKVRIEGGVDCNNNVLYHPDLVIEATKKNGNYLSHGSMFYSRVEGVNSRYVENIDGIMWNLSDVTIHTPVLCNPVVEANNEKYVQLIKPSSATQLVLDPDEKLNDFKLTISNYGHHSYKQGYYTRDLSRSLRDPDVSYLAEENGMLLNQVKFPFDIYIKESSGDKYIKKNTWIVLGRRTATFYLPMWTQEGIYIVECRSIAVNADMSMLDKITEDGANTQLFNYVARKTFQVEVSGRIYGLSVYDLTDYPMWEEAFRVKDSLELKINHRDKYPDGTTKPNYSKDYSYNYTVGTNDQYGNGTPRRSKFTLPLVNGDHPFYKNMGVLKTGYMLRFKLNTIGTLYGSGCRVKIRPTFYYVDANGKNRTQVEIYYEELIDNKNRRLVKMGNKLDKLNTKRMETGSRYTGIPDQELKDTAKIMNQKYTSLKYHWDYLFSFTQIDILSSFKTFTNRAYASKIVKSSEYDKIKDLGVTVDDMVKQSQSWYAYYYMPGIMHVVDPKDVPNGWTVYQYAERKGITYHENWWKKDGYIIVNFDIVTIDSEGHERLSYVNSSNFLHNGNCSMWTMEGAPLSKTDNKGVTFNFKAGDFFIYYAAQSVQDDYSVGGLY